jgi:enoyl-CoA hydratase/carnithine racemase
MDVLVETRDGVCRIHFNRVAKKNAITAAMYSALADAIVAAEADSAARAVLIAGHPDIYTAGNDLEDFLKNPPSGESSPVFRFLNAISTAGKPVVAAVSGAAIGIGTTLLLHCDLIYAAEDARFQLPFAQLGLVPEAASSLLLPALAGYPRAAEKLLLGEPFGAAEALAMGLVTAVVPRAELTSHVEQKLAKLVALPPGAVRATKRLMKSHGAAAVAAHMREEATEFIARLATPAAREAFTAFFERRRPDFSRHD